MESPCNRLVSWNRCISFQRRTNRPPNLGVNVVKMDFLGPINWSTPDLSVADVTSLAFCVQDLLHLEFAPGLA